MKLIQLRYLVAVAENDLNITQAARVLHDPGRRGPRIRGGEDSVPALMA
jgi:hypothetical protein